MLIFLLILYLCFFINVGFYKQPYLVKLSNLKHISIFIVIVHITYMHVKNTQLLFFIDKTYGTPIRLIKLEEIIATLKRLHNLCYVTEGTSESWMHSGPNAATMKCQLFIFKNSLLYSNLIKLVVYANIVFW